MRYSNEKGFSLASALILLMILIGLIGFFSYQYKQFASNEVFLSATIFLVAFGVISVYFIHLYNKSKSENKPKSEIIFEETYKSSTRTYYLYAFVIYLAVFIFLYLFAFNPSAPNFGSYQIFYILLILSALLAPLLLWLNNWIYNDAESRGLKAGFWGLSLGSSIQGGILNALLSPFIILSYLLKRRGHPTINPSKEKSKNLKQFIKPTLIWLFLVTLTTWLLLSYIPSINSGGSMVR